MFAFLQDIVGLLTSVSPEREYQKDGKVTKMRVIELTDHRLGLFDCIYVHDCVCVVFCAKFLIFFQN